MKMKFVKTASLAVLVLALVYSVALFSGCKSDSTAAGPTAKRTMVSDFRADTDYTFIHGNTSPDGTKLFVALNDLDASANGGETALMAGKVSVYLLDIDDIKAGTVTSGSILASNQITGMATAAGTIAFRSSYTPNGAKIVQAAKDRVLVLDGTTLAPLNGASGDTAIGGGSTSFENHDALAIDNDYALLALQSKQSTTGVAALVLYNLNTYAAVGNATNMCTPCHDWTSAKSHFMCGIDGKLTKSGSTYSGNIYVASTSGGHIVEVPLTIDPANTTTPIVVGTTVKKQISNDEGGTTADIIPNFHDVRYDDAAQRVYYSAIKVDSTTGAAATNAHLGYWDLTANTVTHASINATSAAQTGLVYCGSGQTTDYFIPMTMSYPAYIDAIPKSLLVDGATIVP